jgi:hypothetical protein
MSSLSCYSGSNNIHFNDPPLMTDGRNYANWQPEAVINSQIQKKEGIHTNWEYRNFLQKNGIEIRKFNAEQTGFEITGHSLYNNVATNTQINKGTPFLFKGTHDTTIPKFGYCSSDLKSPYLTREQLNARIISPHVQVK